jgi:lysophospholipase L1-like esterase
VQDDAGAIYATWRAHRAGASRWIDTLPDLGPALAEYDRNVRELARLCSAAGARPLFLTQPCLWSANAPVEHEERLWMGGVGDYQKEPGAPYYTTRALAAGLARFNAALLATCARIGVDCLDLAAVVPPDGAAFYDDVHFNEAGARRVAAAVAEALR